MQFVSTDHQKADILTKGLTAKDFKLVIVANREEIDAQPLRQIAQWCEGLERGFEPMNPLHNPEPYLEIELMGDNLLMHPQTRSQAATACDVKGRATATPMGSSSLIVPSRIRGKMICVMEGNFMSKGAPRMGEVKHFQPGTHINQQVPERLGGSPLPLETILHIHTWHARYRA